MTHKIIIYGDIVPFKWMNDGSEYSLKDLKDSLEELVISEGDELIIDIHTFGGDTTTAFGMYNLIKRFKTENSISVKTRVDGYCASSGVIILLAGDRENRIGSKYLKPFVHNAWSWSFAMDKNEAQKIFEDLDKVDNEIADLYAEETSITKEEALQFMNESRDLTIEECKKYGFYSELENVRVIENSAVFNSIISRNVQNRQKFQNNMSDKNKKSAWNKLKNQIDDFFGGAKNKIVYTADNSELDFYELGENDTPAVGDKAIFDGKAAGESNDGEYVMPSGETYKFMGEELTEIVAKAEDNAEDFAAENETLKEEVSNLKEEVKNLKSEKSALNKKLENATTIINNFKNLDAQFEDEEDEDEKKRSGFRTNGNAPKTRALDAIKNLKNKNKDGNNK
ncbi:ATP-dependent Clp protease proteolytic subunit [Elizabethkingia ursingii]|uniref:ATP-dependent Clp protease proteolytic subunit n=1 Tax=Elizabethkingia ursingii TaxID=1756150 RepID=UPI000750F5B4|nr:ATP-dependent Clp protease proteolytic subunit [Elizabethkingia ursingii]KUY29395.1 hypothetical protein ATB96_18945 [Elizabethkingia ursingii]